MSPGVPEVVVEVEDLKIRLVSILNSRTRHIIRRVNKNKAPLQKIFSKIESCLISVDAPYRLNHGIIQYDSIYDPKLKPSPGNIPSKNKEIL